MYLTLHPRAKNLAGRRFGKLVAIGATRHTKDISGRSLLVWECTCDCGKTVETRSCNLLSGDTKSCGCLERETLIKRNKTHGKSKTSTYRKWAAMIQRCYQPTSSSYAYYGGRGISVCERWRSSFEAFLEDMGECPSPKHSPDRIETNGHYEPGNVRWATHGEQMTNTRRNRYLTAFGETMHMQEWCRRFGLKQGTLWDRLDRGWPIERALSEPLRRRQG
jgi:hypothetical protein